MRNITLDDLVINGQLTLLGQRVINGEVVIKDCLKQEFLKALDKARQQSRYSKDRGVCADW